MRKNDKSHAPRERVSWNNRNWGTPYRGRTSRSTWACELKCEILLSIEIIWIVTLHVSVWVEIHCKIIVSALSTSRSTWACELKSKICFPISTTFSSRSTWACELKCQRFVLTTWKNWRHAPRERVSWNLFLLHLLMLFYRSRSTWACELKFISCSHTA